MKPGHRVFYAEYGHGAREGRVDRVYRGNVGRGVIVDRVLVRFTDGSGRWIDCFAGSVFPTRAAAEKSLASLDDPRPKLAPARRQTPAAAPVGSPRRRTDRRSS